MTNNKIVIFDWGGIAVNLENNDLEYHNVIIRALRRLGCTFSDEEILKIWYDHDKNGIAVHADTITSLDDITRWWDLGKGKFRVTADYDTFNKTYEEEFLKAKYYQDVIDFSHSLKDKCKIGILSNLALFDKRVIDAHYHLADFDKVYLSCELGKRKPDKEIYQYIQNDLEISPENILFLDDLEQNVLAAKSCGWQAHQVTGNHLPEIKSFVDTFLETQGS